MGDLMFFFIPFYINFLNSTCITFKKHFFLSRKRNMTEHCSSQRTCVVQGLQLAVSARTSQAALLSFRWLIANSRRWSSAQRIIKITWALKKYLPWRSSG